MLSEVVNVQEAPKQPKMTPEEQRAAWEKLINEECAKQEKAKKPTGPKPKTDQVDLQRVLGSDLDVYVRVRPLLPEEKKRDELPVVFTPAPASVLATETRLDVRGVPRIRAHTFNVDGALGPEVLTSDIQSRIMNDPLRLAKDGGISTVLAYGQTGTGKTFTVEGLLRGMGQDLFSDVEIRALDLHLCSFELLGNNATDLLSEGQKGIVEIIEDQFGHIGAKNATEVQVRDESHLAELITACLASRRTRSTFKNDASSRSHAVFAFRFQNTRLKAAEDGKLFVVDLAGSETTADSRFHDKGAIAETKQINASLMALKECVRSRALSSLHPEKIYHVPYRQSKLTLLLKDAFELESRRLCKTVVIACVSPAQTDMSMSLNTLRYAAPFKIGQVREKLKEDPDNPATWTNEQLRKWVTAQSKGAIDPETLCPWESGMQMLRLPEAEFLLRIMDNNKAFCEKRAKAFYTELWKLLVDARTKERRMKMKPRNKTERMKPCWEKNYAKELAEKKKGEQGWDDVGFEDVSKTTYKMMFYSGKGAVKRTNI